MLHASKVRHFALILALNALFCIAANGQSTPAVASAAAPTKIGIVSLQDAIFNTNEGKKEFDALQTRFSTRNSELKSQGEEIDKLKTQLQAQQDKLSEAARATQVKNIADKQKPWQRKAEDFQNEVQQAEQDVMSRLGQKMLTVLEKYAQANGYAVILDVSNQQTPVLWASPGSNITKELVDAYNAANPAMVPAPAKKPATGTGPAKPAGTTTPKKP